MASVSSEALRVWITSGLRVAARRGCGCGNARAATPCRPPTGRPAGSSPARSRQWPPPAARGRAPAGRPRGLVHALVVRVHAHGGPEVVVARAARPCTASNSSIVVQMHSARSTLACAMAGADGGQSARQFGKGQVAVGIDKHAEIKCAKNAEGAPGSGRPASELAANPASDQMVWVGRPSQGVPRISSILSLSWRDFSSLGKLDAHALGAVAGRLGRGDPGHLAGHRVALRVVGQRQQHVDVVAQLVLARGGDEDAALGKQRDVGRVQRRLFLDGQLDDAGARRWRACSWVGLGLLSAGV
jgi:hypothetical protein